MQYIKNIIKSVSLWLGYIFHHNRKSKVLYYHDVGTMYTNMGTPFYLLKEHIRLIKERGFEIVPEISEDEGQIMLAFDDGWKGIYDEREFFVKEGICPTVFIAVDLIGNDGYLSKEQIDELYELGFRFESHTWTHTGLHTHHGEDLVHETMAAKLRLEELFERPFRDICYPQGIFSSEVIEACNAAQYDKMYSCISGNYYDYYKYHIICRNLIQFTSSRNLKYILEGNSALMRKRDISLMFVGKWPY